MKGVVEGLSPVGMLILIHGYDPMLLKLSGEMQTSVTCHISFNIINQLPVAST